MVKITCKMLEELRSERGGYTKATIQSLGIPYPLVSGWQQKLVMSQGVTEEQYAKALEGRGILRKWKHFKQSKQAGGIHKKNRNRKGSATAKQLDLLVALGEELHNVVHYSKRDASNLIARLKREPSDKQLAFLLRLECPPERMKNLDREAAKNLIDDLLHERRKNGETDFGNEHAEFWAGV